MRTLGTLKKMGDDFDYLGPKVVCDRTSCTVRPTPPVAAWNAYYPALQPRLALPIVDRPLLPPPACAANAYEAVHASYVAHDPRVACVPPPYLTTREAGYFEVGYLVPLAPRHEKYEHYNHAHCKHEACGGECHGSLTKRGSRFHDDGFAGRPYAKCHEQDYGEGCGRRYRLYVRTPAAYGCRAFGSSSYQYQYAVREEGVYDAIWITLDQAKYRDHGCGHGGCGNGRGRWSELVTGDIVHVPGGCGVPYRVHLYADDYNGRW